MGRKSVGLPDGVEARGETVRVRFTWNGQRRSEPTPHKPTAKGLASAGSLCARVKEMIKMGVMTEDLYAQLFPNSNYNLDRKTPTFGEFAQIWLNSRDIVKGTRENYTTILNGIWMPELSARRIDDIMSADIRRIVASVEWDSPGIRRNAMDKLSSVLATAVIDGHMQRNPCKSMPRAKLPKRQVDPFERVEAERIIADMYEALTDRTKIYAAYFEFCFFTGMRPGEVRALKWSEVDEDKKRVHVCRQIVKGELVERIKTKSVRDVLLNKRALHALEVAKSMAKDGASFIFAPLLGQSEWIKSDSTTKKYFMASLVRLDIRRRRQYDCRHTYATMCLMANMNTAFIANQLGHSVQMLLSTYAKWINSTSDWAELDKL
ncbi:tyrosine-type recombinase/integrase [Pseudomonas sp. 10B1]|uniref:tyrosine-type recombinase/integrase n=2 Tax=Pseudomonadota TaxID=1224 RepID=UPI002B23E9B6|nr:MULTISPECIES: tyrosine-type recombinase/integrase [unclassified Pseudomonas]MEA9994588.1 tyrosine-type recombinase/integrase [Pseudomonas sp. AA4]MEB0085733.1 tyrosine-type recombinase/integrase [Pseudomonas sp. RTI1]MEB0125942.1 tyrosine-type recombinase/integrase [Pseudomonas sp. CCC1.2]MEB0152746.1 tyrosine-type recombinase/integrase [Pseudomonas sp. CCC4.3]MEB0220131.1 tyrosine-type recombinase/integrase [Pseudomonas sp. AB12(2023)]